MKKIAVIGLGHIGLITAAVLASFGHEVIGYDTETRKIDLLKKGLTPLQEPKLKELLANNQDNLVFTTEPHLIVQSEVVIIAVNTPEGENGCCDLTKFYEAVDVVMKTMQKDFVMIIKSTVPPGTNALVQKYISKYPRTVTLISNPEFARQGQAVEDMLNPERIVIGANEEKAFTFCYNFYEMYYQRDIPVIFVSPETAEMAKYASNSYLAVRLAYINEIANLCEVSNADVKMVAKIMGLDSRIGAKHLNTGIGVGGPSLKDVRTLNCFANKKNVTLDIVSSTLKANSRQPEIFVNKIIDRFGGMSGEKTIAVLGLSFKSNTSDITNSPSLKIVEGLLEAGFKVIGYDPCVSMMFASLINKKALFQIGYDLKNTIYRADAIAILTESDEWKNMTGYDFQQIMKSKTIIFDGLNLYNVSEMSDVEYHSIGRPSRHVIK